MTVDDVINEVNAKANGRTRYQGQEPYRDELLVKEIERLEAVLHKAFMAMCDQRDNPDAEVFQDAIDELGMAVSDPSN